MQFGTIIQIDDILVSEDVIFDFFSCDYEKCKGKCCIVGDSGAPLEEAETSAIEEGYDNFKEEMQPQGRSAVEKKGFFEIDRDGDLVTPLVDDTQECAFCHFDKEKNCLCAIEKCHYAGKSRFRKPQSCALYPIRVTKHKGGMISMNMHHWDICNEAYEKGKKEGIRAYQFLRAPLTEYYGEEFYSMLSAAAENLFSKK